MQSFETGDADFVVFSRAEILRMKLFEPGTGHPCPKSHHFKSHHAGLTVQEMHIPLIAIT